MQPWPAWHGDDHRAPKIRALAFSLILRVCPRGHFPIFGMAPRVSFGSHPSPNQTPQIRQVAMTRAEDMLVIHSGSSSFVEELYRVLRAVPP